MKKLQGRVLNGAESKRQILLMGLLSFLLVLLAVKVPGKFYTVYNFRSMAFQLPELGLLSLGMLLVVITGGIDLSLTYTASLSGICCALVLNSCVKGGMSVGAAIVLAVLTSLVVSVLLGVFKGYFVAVLGVHPWLVTLGTMTLFSGLGIILTKGGSISGFPQEFYNAIGNCTILGIPLTMLILVIVLIVLGMALHRTDWGRRLLLVGSNEKVARFSGISVRKMIFSAYVISSFIAGISGVIMVSRYNSAKVDHGYLYLMQTIAIIVLSGADINGGRANIFSMTVTMIIMQVLYTGVSMLGGDRYSVVILTGIILIGILLMNTLLDHHAKKKEVVQMMKQNNA